MFIPSGLHCDVCGKPFVGGKAMTCRLEGVDEEIHVHPGECYEHFNAALATESFSDLPEGSPLRRWAEGDEDPWREQRAAYEAAARH